MADKKIVKATKAEIETGIGKTGKPWAMLNVSLEIPGKKTPLVKKIFLDDADKLLLDIE